MSPLPGLPHLPDPGGEEDAVLGPEAPGLCGWGLHGAGREEGPGGGGRDDSGTSLSSQSKAKQNGVKYILEEHFDIY